jgi:hypothetical protein
MRKTKSTARRSYMVTTSSSSSENDMSLGANQEKVPAPPINATSSNAISQRRGGVPSQQNHFTRKYEAQWKDDHLM